MQVPTVTNVTLNGTIATAHVTTRAGLWKDAVSIIPKLLGACPQGKHCQKQLRCTLGHSAFVTQDA